MTATLNDQAIEQEAHTTGGAARSSADRAGRGGGERPIRVLIVAPSLRSMGGQAVQAARLLARFQGEPSLSVSFLPINPQLPGPLGALQAIKYIRTLLTFPLYIATLLARVPHFDVLHVFSASYLSFVLAPTPAILVAKLYRKKVILNYRSGEAEDHLQRWRRTALPTIGLVDAVAVPSGYLVDVFARFGVRARSIFNIVDTSHFRFRERKPLRPVCLSNRSLEALYNVGCVLRAFALVQKRFPDARLTIVGDGSQRAGLEALARDLDLRDTNFVGYVPHGEIREYYDAADVFLNGSDIDNMPGSIIESYAAGLPVVSTDAGGIPYILSHEETGLLVRRGDFNAMAECVIRLLEEPALGSAIINAAHDECRKYSWEAVRREWLDLYHHVARRHVAAG